MAPSHGDSSSAGHARSARGHGQDAVQALWQTHRRWIAAILLAHKPREADLDDLLQEVAMSVVQSIHTLKDPALVRPWLRSIAMNAARTSGRRASARRRNLPVTHDEPDRTVGDDGAENESLARGRRALELARALPAEYREPLYLRAVRGMSYRQIADTLSLPVTTIETRLARARRMLREDIERDEQLANEKRTDAQDRESGGATA
jgi:RNA polymerase sigma-70 factor (ECF subfamily)